LRDTEREYLIVLNWLGFERATVAFTGAERPSGKSAYSLRRLLRVALAGMLFRTTVLLRWVVALGFLIAVAGVGLAVADVYSYFTSKQPSGYTSLAVLQLLLAGFLIVSLGVVGLYVGRIFEQVKGRPQFIIDEEVSSDEELPLASAESMSSELR
jgi:hypothetical protein